MVTGLKNDLARAPRGSRPLASLLAGAMLACSASAAYAQDEAPREPLRIRVTLGPQLEPSYPGADRVALRPYFDVDFARGSKEFRFEAPNESLGFPVVRIGGLELGPVAGMESKRDADAVGAPIHKVGFSIEAGAFVQAQILADSVRLRAEARKGLTGHRGWIGVVSADYIARDGDAWLFSVGPRVTFTDRRYQRAYFGITTTDAAATGLPLYDAGGGIQSAGMAAGWVHSLSSRWGPSSYVSYERLVGDPADSPVTRTLGSRNQFAGGVGLSYTFGMAR
jgi:MipA family protein